MFINGGEKVGIEDFKNQKTFIDYSRISDDVSENLEDYIPTKKKRVLIMFDDMIEDIVSNKELSSIVTNLISRCLKL